MTRGGYILADAADGKPEVILIATGSELAPAVEAHEQLTAAGIASRVVSMPSQELFNAQPESYRDEVLPPSVTARVAIEAGVRQGWDRYLGSQGKFIGMDRFGLSAPFKKLYEEFGITADRIVETAKRLAGK